MRRPADGDRPDGPVGLGIDDRDIVTGTVGHDQGRIVRGQGRAPHPAAGQDVGCHGSRGDVDPGDVPGPAQGDEGGGSIPGHDQVDRRDVGFAQAAFLEADGVGDLQGGGIDDADGAPEFVGHPVFAPVRGEDAPSRTVADQNVCQNGAGPGVDHDHRVGRFCGDEDPFAIRGEGDALGLDADILDHRTDGTGGNVDDGGGRIILVRDHENLAGGVDIEDFGIIAGLDVAGQGLGLEIENLDAVGLARGDEQLVAARAETQVAGPSPGFDDVLHFEGVEVEHDHGVIAFVADVHLPGGRGQGEAGGGQPRGGGVQVRMDHRAASPRGRWPENLPACPAGWKHRPRGAARPGGRPAGWCLRAA